MSEYECRYFWPEPVYIVDAFTDKVISRLMPGEKYHVEPIFRKGRKKTIKQPKP